MIEDFFFSNLIIVLFLCKCIVVIFRYIKFWVCYMIEWINLFVSGWDSKLNYC